MGKQIKYFNNIQLNEPKGGGNISIPFGAKPGGKIPPEATLAGRRSPKDNPSQKLTEMQMQQSNRKPDNGQPFGQGKPQQAFSQASSQNMMNQFLSDSNFRQQQLSTAEGRNQFRNSFLTAMRGNPEGISQFFQRWNDADAGKTSGGLGSTSSTAGVSGTTNTPSSPSSSALPGYAPGAKGIQEGLMRKIDRTYKPTTLVPQGQQQQSGISKELAFALTNKGQDNNDDSRYGSRGGDARLRNPATRDKYVSVNGNTISRDSVYGKPQAQNQNTSALYSSFTNSYRFPGQNYGQMQPLLNSPQTGGYQTNLLNTQQTQGQMTNMPWNPGIRAGKSFFVPPGAPNGSPRRK